MPSHKKRSGKKTKGLKKHKYVNRRSRKNNLGRHKTGGNPYLAYTGNLNTNSSSMGDLNLAYTGTGGSSAISGTTSGNMLAKPSLPINLNGMDKTNPSTGPSSASNGTSFSLSSTNLQSGGCGCSSPIVPPPMQQGGSNHRSGCKCSMCKQTGGSNGKYPDGLVGSNWGSSPQSWPGVDGTVGNRNYLALNKYNNDISRNMTNTSASGLPLKGGKKTLKNRKQKGGVLSNFLAQDLINLGRQFQYDVGSAYNGIRGYQAPVNPMPWKDQLSTTPGNMNALKYL